MFISQRKGSEKFSFLIVLLLYHHHHHHHHLLLLLLLLLLLAILLPCERRKKKKKEEKGASVNCELADALSHRREVSCCPLETVWLLPLVL